MVLVATHVGFLRAVNLGRRRVRMPHLVDLAGGLGHGNVWTYVNSGNVVFDATGSRAELEGAFEAALEADLGFEVTTFVRTATELRRALALGPFTRRPDVLPDLPQGAAVEVQGQGARGPRQRLRQAGRPRP